VRRWSNCRRVNHVARGSHQLFPYSLLERQLVTTSCPGRSSAARTVERDIEKLLGETEAGELMITIMATIPVARTHSFDLAVLC
jgi:hypothetical protein